LSTTSCQLQSDGGCRCRIFGTDPGSLPLFAGLRPCAYGVNEVGETHEQVIDAAAGVTRHPAQGAKAGILNFVEGGNEEDTNYAAQQGNTLAITAQFQQQVYALGHSLGLPVINMSFGGGWTADNNWQGNYGTVGDLGAYADYGNAHTYPNVGQGTGWSMDRLNGLARLADSSDPVITTELGWNEAAGCSQADIAKWVLDAAMDGMKLGDVKTYFYSLFDDMSGQFGLMNADGTPKPAGTALHNLTTLLGDTGATAGTFATGSLSYSLSGATANDDTLLFEKSDGSYWLSLWNEDDAAHNEVDPEIRTGD